jgi:hypothetical protein
VTEANIADGLHLPVYVGSVIDPTGFELAMTLTGRSETGEAHEPGEGDLKKLHGSAWRREVCRKWRSREDL